VLRSFLVLELVIVMALSIYVKFAGGDGAVNLCEVRREKASSNCG